MIGTIIAWIVIGLIAGALAKLIMPGDDPGGIIITIIIGLIGAVIGGWIVSFFGKSGANGFNIYSIIVSIIGALVLLGIYRLVVGRRAM